MQAFYRTLKLLFLIIFLILLSSASLIVGNEVGCRKSVEQFGFTEISQKNNIIPSDEVIFSNLLEIQRAIIYANYAKVLDRGEPHNFGHLSSIWNYWQSVCKITQISELFGGFSRTGIREIYAVSIDMTWSLIARSAYEGTIGRLFATIDGSRKTNLEIAFQNQALAFSSAYFNGYEKVWSYEDDLKILTEIESKNPRDYERKLFFYLRNRLSYWKQSLFFDSEQDQKQNNFVFMIEISGITAFQIHQMREVNFTGYHNNNLIVEIENLSLLESLEKIVQVGGSIVRINGFEKVWVVTQTSNNERSNLETILKFSETSQDIVSLKLLDAAEFTATISKGDILKAL